MLLAYNTNATVSASWLSIDASRPVACAAAYRISYAKTTFSQTYGAKFGALASSDNYSAEACPIVIIVHPAY